MESKMQDGSGDWGLDRSRVTSTGWEWKITRAHHPDRERGKIFAGTETFMDRWRPKISLKPRIRGLTLRHASVLRQKYRKLRRRRRVVFVGPNTHPSESIVQERREEWLH